MDLRRFRHTSAMVKRVYCAVAEAFWYPADRCANYLSETTNGSFKFIYDDPWRYLAFHQLGTAAHHCLARRIYLGYVRRTPASGGLWLRAASIR